MKISAVGLHLEVSARSTCTEEGWCAVHVTARIPGIETSFDAWMQGSDFSRFAAEIDRLYESVGQSGSARLVSNEPGLEIVLTMEQLGGVVGRYRLETYRIGVEPAVLSGPFELDQSYLPPLRDGVLELLEELDGGNEA